MKIFDIEFKIPEYSEGTLALIPKSEDDGILQIDCSLGFRQATSPKEIVLSFALPYRGIASFFTPSPNQRSFSPPPEWSPVKLKSRLSVASPVIQCVGYNDLNCYTIALSDVKTPSMLSAGVVEEDGTVKFEIHLFTSLVSPIKDYNVTIYIDKRKIPYVESLKSLESYWQSVTGVFPCRVPDDALHPLYSFWYSYHQKFTTEEIVAECKRAKALGMNTVILDDGWQTEDNSRGYAYCGDWEIASSKIPDIKALTDAVHALGMKILFWFSVPFVGKYSKNFEAFQGMYLDNNETIRRLDPRFPQVRKFLIDKWVCAIKEWDLDGLKLDFIDDMYLTEVSPKNDPRMDEVSLENGIEKLLKEAYDAITATKKDALIEYRQSYVGPIIQAYGNMIRVADCPNDAHSNRIRSMQLRLLTHTTAIHSDMLMWHKDESPEFAARQLTAVLFTVPQISVRLDTISQDQKAMLSYYLSLWEKHRDVLLYGALYPHSPDCHFPLIEAENEKERFIVAYAQSVLEVKSEKSLVYVNATDEEKMYIDILCPSENRSFRITNCKGECLQEGSVNASGILSFNVPPSGVLEIF